MKSTFRKQKADGYRAKFAVWSPRNVPPSSASERSNTYTKRCFYSVAQVPETCRYYSGSAERLDRVLASCCQHFRKLSFWRVSRTAKRSVRGVKTTDMPIPPKIAFAVLACLPRESPPLPIEPRLHKIRVVHRGVIRPSFRSVNEKRTTVFGRPSVC
jgi:hypothetical protein